jgi:type VI protein secretion system component VasA
VSKLQTLTALSTTEAELIALSTALRQTLWLMRIVKEMKDEGYNIKALRPTIRCKAFEDNSGAIAIARMPRARPRTKHMAIRFHHFKNHVGKDVDIEAVSTDDQHADMETKSLSLEKMRPHREYVQGW